MRYRQLHHLSKEAAGVLIGERRGPHLIICDISEPGSGDVRDRFNVDRKGLIIRKRLLPHLSLQAEHFSILVSGIRILRMTLHHRAKIISHGVK